MIRVVVALYGLALRLLPRGLQDDHHAEIVALFERTVRDAGANGARAACAAVAEGWLGALRAVPGAWRDELAGGRSRLEWGPRGERGKTMSIRMTLRQATRSLVRSPRVTLGVVGLFGLGIGATVTVLSVVDGVLVRSLPYPEADRLVVVQDAAHAWPDFRDWQETVPAFEVLAAASGQTFTLTEAIPQHLEGARISAEFLAMMGAETSRGRLPSADEYAEGRRVTVLGDAAWRRRWGGDPEIVGRTIPIDGIAYQVIGILDAAFQPPDVLTGTEVDVWVPVDPADPELTRHTRSFNVAGRLAPGVSVEGAAVQLEARAIEFASAFPDLYADDAGEPRRRFAPATLADETRGDARGPLSILLAGALLLLLVACGNAASILLARGASRRGELATRRALGGGRRTILAQLLAESTILAVAGWGVGVALAVGGVELFKTLEPGDLPRIGMVSVDLRVAGVALLIAVAAGALAGFVPAWSGSRASPAAVLRRSASGSRGRNGSGIRRGLVLGEAALASLLLVGALTVVQGFSELTVIEPGFEPDGVYALSIDVGRELDEEGRARVTEALLDRLGAFPDVHDVGAGLNVPFEVAGGNRCCWRGSLALEEGDGADAWVHPVTPGYFSALGARFRVGRGFVRGDEADGTDPVILNATAAERIFGGATEVGQSVFFGSRRLRVIGVIEDLRHWGPDQPVEAEFYLPYGTDGSWASGLTFALRGTPPASEVLRAAVAEAAPRAVVGEVRPMHAVMARSLARYRFYTMVLTVFAASALLLACTGLGGTLLYDARLRAYELGVRAALGAGTGALAVRVVARASLTVAIGSGVGLLAFWPVRSRLGALVPGGESLDPVSLAAFIAVLAVSAGAAAWIPARFVARTDPARVLG